MPTQAANPMLFLPPHAPVSLPTSGTVVIGRSNSADIRFPDIDTSRHHAEIVCEDGRCVIRDLSSTNGTWINGKRAEAPHELKGGDRVEIGETEITFCEIEVETAAGDDAAQTHLTERPVTTQVFSGDLAEIPPFAVVQILEMGRKSGVLCLEADSGPGKLWFQKGDPIHAETKEQLGFDAALTLVNASSGFFTFQPQLDSPEATIQATVTQLLLEASRLLDEASLLEE